MRRCRGSGELDARLCTAQHSGQPRGVSIGSPGHRLQRSAGDERGIGSAATHPSARDPTPLPYKQRDSQPVGERAAEATERAAVTNGTGSGSGKGGCGRRRSRDARREKPTDRHRAGTGRNYQIAHSHGLTSDGSERTSESHSGPLTRVGDGKRFFFEITNSRR